MVNNHITSKFQQSMEETGITPPDIVVIESQYHRFPTNEKPDASAGWYVLSDMGYIVVGAFGDWRTGVKVSWKSVDDAKLDKALRKRVKVEITRAKKLAEQKRKTDQDKAAEEAERIWNEALEVNPTHFT